MSKSGWLIGALIVVAGAGIALYVSRNRTPAVRFRKEKVERGEVVASVTAAGTLSAVTTVKVGSQVSGIIARLHADFNSNVKKGELLAELDPAPFQAAVDQRRADLEKARVELRNAELIFVRNGRLTKEQLLAQSDMDTAQANRDASRATVQQAEAGLKQALTNLAYARITSPIDGTVVDRQYDVGQTVAASFQAPVLFTIAQDLTKMEVLTNIDESDIGRVQMKQEASFSVDAFPNRPYQGSVSQIRLSPQTVQNVVTYPVMIDVSNPEAKLKPGMTANVQIPVDSRKNVLRVPNAALRFRPAASDLVPEAKQESKDGPPAGHGGKGGGGGGGGTREGGASRNTLVYVEAADGKLKPVKVKSSITDGNVTAVESEELKEGNEVVVGLATLKAGDSVSGRPPAGGPQQRGPRM